MVIDSDSPLYKKIPHVCVEAQQRLQLENSTWSCIYTGIRSGIVAGVVCLGLQERTGYTPPAKDKDAINRLKAVYGAMPPYLTPEYKRTEKSIGLLKVRKREGV